MTDSNPSEDICVSVKTNNKWGCLGMLAFSKRWTELRLVVVPYGIRADLRKTAQHLSSFKQIANRGKSAGEGRGDGGGTGEERKWWVGEERSKQGQLACFKHLKT